MARPSSILSALPIRAALPVSTKGFAGSQGMSQSRMSASHATARERGAMHDRAHSPMRVAPRGDETPTAYPLREHYLIERELADRLRSAPRSERGALYSELYDELFRRVPYHPMLHVGDLPQREHDITRPLRLLRSFLTCESVFMEIGAGDCALAMRAASLAKQVYAIDVSEEITRSVVPPGNFKLILSDGCSIPVPEGGIDVAFSNQLMEHLHPEDAGEQLRNIYRSLAPGGAYVCITPNRMYGPHDISKHFDQIATGFHLREYTAREIRKLFVDAGFAEVRFYASARGRFLRCPYWVIAALESTLGALPYPLRKRLAYTKPMRAVLGLWVAAIKKEAL
ncbi:MAG: class I SAM-dependent methyltransferase [Betaproteobacteria bacterium]|nr:MAG: class I SAM-dependent methyltransferase [Betaproteobacteria bacterium]